MFSSFRIPPVMNHFFKVFITGGALVKMFVDSEKKTFFSGVYRFSQRGGGKLTPKINGEWGEVERCLRNGDLRLIYYA